MDKIRILLVEDDASLADWISVYLTSHNYVVDHVEDGLLAVKKIKKDNPDLVLLDVMLPNKNGFDICKEVLSYYHNPILMLTACNDESDEILGLELGATDFIGKPVRPKVLLARIKALLRREQQMPASSMLTFDQLQLDFNNKSVFLAQQSITVTVTEFDLLWCLAKSAGTIVSRETLLQNRRGIEYDGFDRSIDIAISRLRKKLGDIHNPPEKIKTIRAKGYLFAANAWHS
jgi:two-component system OmpR family response regulator/two-component system response regulator RstA